MLLYYSIGKLQNGLFEAAKKYLGTPYLGKNIYNAAIKTLVSTYFPSTSITSLASMVHTNDFFKTMKSGKRLQNFDFKGLELNRKTLALGVWMMAGEGVKYGVISNLGIIFLYLCLWEKILTFYFQSLA